MVKSRMGKLTQGPIDRPVRVRHAVANPNSHESGYNRQGSGIRENSDWSDQRRKSLNAFQPRSRENAVSTLLLSLYNGVCTQE